MKMQSLDHINVRTSNLHQMQLWYERVLGMSVGPRPDFTFPGAWMYVDDHPAIHLVGVTATDEPSDSLQLQHFAIKASGLKQFVEHLQYHEVDYTLRQLPGGEFDVTQVFIQDADGNNLHIDFHNES